VNVKRTQRGDEIEYCVKCPDCRMTARYSTSAFQERYARFNVRAWVEAELMAALRAGHCSHTFQMQFEA
jgi:hypothetical protein